MFPRSLTYHEGVIMKKVFLALAALIFIGSAAIVAGPIEQDNSSWSGNDTSRDTMDTTTTSAGN